MVPSQNCHGRLPKLISMCYGKPSRGQPKTVKRTLKFVSHKLRKSKNLGETLAKLDKSLEAQSRKYSYIQNLRREINNFAKECLSTSNSFQTGSKSARKMLQRSRKKAKQKAKLPAFSPPSPSDKIHTKFVRQTYTSSSEDWSYDLGLIIDKLENSGLSVSNLVATVHLLKFVPEDRIQDNFSAIERILELVLEGLSQAKKHNINDKHLADILQGIQAIPQSSLVINGLLNWILELLKNSKINIREQGNIGRALYGLYWHKHNPLAQELADLICKKSPLNETTLVKDAGLMRSLTLMTDLNLPNDGAERTGLSSSIEQTIQSHLNKFGITELADLSFNKYWGGFEADILSLKLGINIEIDGDQHETVVSLRRDTSRDLLLALQGIRVIRVKPGWRKREEVQNEVVKIIMSELDIQGYAIDDYQSFLIAPIFIKPIQIAA